MSKNTSKNENENNYIPEHSFTDTSFTDTSFTDNSFTEHHLIYDQVVDSDPEFSDKLSNFKSIEVVMKQEWEDEVSRTSFIERKKLEPIERQIAQHEDGSVEEDDHEFTKMVEQIEKCGNDGMRVGCTNNAMVDFDHKAFDYLVLLDQTSDKIGKNGKNGKDERMGILSRIFCCGEESTEDEKRMNLILFRKRKGSPKRMVANTKNIRVVVE